MTARGKSKRVTLVDVAREANCSVSMASIVMRDAAGASEETRRRVKAVAKRLGYRTDQRARALRSARSGLIGVTFAVHQPFHAKLVESLYHAVESAPTHRLVLSAVIDTIDDRSAADTLLRDRVDALVMVAPSIGAARLRILADEVPVVTLARPISSTAVDIIRIDDRGGLALAVDHLVSLGHRRIVHVDGSTAPSSAERSTGYLEAMSSHGLGAEICVLPGGIEQEHGLAAAAAMVERARSAGGMEHLPTGVVAFNDRLAGGIVLGLQAAGVSVPGQVSVVGFDNARRAHAGTLALTTIDQNTDLMARLALERAIGRAANSYLPTEQVIVPRLVVRDSTAPAQRRR